jgi:hypothetical protein
MKTIKIILISRKSHQRVSCTRYGNVKFFVKTLKKIVLPFFLTDSHISELHSKSNKLETDNEMFTKRFQKIVSFLVNCFDVGRYKLFFRFRLAAKIFDLLRNLVSTRSVLHKACVGHFIHTPDLPFFFLQTQKA